MCFTKRPVSSGVPQGYVLGRLLFLLYINYLNDNIDVTLKLFADDCVIHNSLTSYEDHIRLNNNLKKIQKNAAGNGK